MKQTEKNEPKRILIIDDEENMRHMLMTLLKRAGYEVFSAADGEQGLRMAIETSYDFVLCDIRMPRLDGMEFLKKGVDALRDTTVIMMSAYGTVDMAIDAMKQGAYDYISKPFKTDEVLLTLKKAEERERLKRENLRLREQIDRIGKHYVFSEMVADSSEMRDVFNLAEKASRYDTTVLITGESGTGKELVARGIHDTGNRSKMPMIPINCGGIPENLLESEFFGYRKGAFTGADMNRKGLFEEAEGGTIFLDEVGELPMALQVKLLRVIQEREIRRIGESKTRPIDVRVIAATSKNLEKETRDGRFREDLFYRLNVLPIRIPPLRERTSDIPLLVDHFIQKYRLRLKKDIEGIAPDAMSLLIKYNWPGNVRELENNIERAVVLAEKPLLVRENFPEEIENRRDLGGLEDVFNGYSIKAAQRVLEKELIKKALAATGGNRTQAGKLLEISHPSLLTKLKAYKIEDH